MKITKMLLVMFFAVAAVSCNKDDDNGPEPFLLSTSNVAGTYKIAAVTANSISTANVSGSIVTVATTTVVGDTFQVTMVFNANGTFTATGNYRIVTTVTPSGQDPIVEQEILSVNSSGAYSTNATNQTITVNANDDTFIDGTFDVTLFNQSAINLAQEDISTDGGITTTTNASLNLVRQ